MSMLERLTAKTAGTTAVDISRMVGPELFKALRAIPDKEERRSTTSQVYLIKMKEYRRNPLFESTMAEHLVDDVHPMFRRGFAEVIRKSTPTSVHVVGFNKVNHGLHHHHGIEDQYWFPQLKYAHPEFGVEIDILESEHASLVGLEKSIQAGSYESLVEFAALLNDHLNREEMITVPFLMDGTGGL